LELIYKTRKLVKPEDLNPRGTLFGGRVLEWLDEEAAIFAMCKLNSNDVVTKAISEINFKQTAKKGDIIEFGMGLSSIGNTSISITCDIRNKNTQESILHVEKITFVLLDENDKPKKHNLLPIKHNH